MAEWIQAPYAIIGATCYAPDGSGGASEVWQASCPHNVVVQQGKAQLIKRAFGFQTASTFGMYVVPHSASTATGQVWGDISASRLQSYGSVAAKVTFATNGTVASQSGSTSYAFSAGTQTISGFAMLWYTASSLAEANLSVTADLGMFNNGTVATQQIVSNNTLSVNITVSMS